MSTIPPPPGPPMPPSDPPPVSPPPQQPPPYTPPPQAAAPGPIPNHLVWAIIATVFSLCLCCGIPGLITGIVAIVFAAKVNGLLAAGDFDGALRASKNAKTWAIVTTVLAAIGLLWTVYSLTLGHGMAEYQMMMEQIKAQSGR
ncbi:CD225/dispanin family protein [Pseudoxanthomonas sp. JBR18]|uniref:CD225/dispanin family protein n=1 Tax=Pseudoxanthomonas sp. JBR18 TaxID=2969308 RepID=UPI002306B468|nr:CD225/dispanin family protein [Pseudoxanthomonas sp. JBR18]WCE04972.1 CD225/dispanin family protein [Pseudoxanthomonas sp. JBR18]